MIYKLIYWLALVLLVNIQIANGITLYDVGLPEPRLTTSQKMPCGSVECINATIATFAKKYSVEGKIGLLEKIVFCESTYKVNAVNHTEKEYSVGLVQINLMAHPHITYEQAVDVDFAIEFLVKNVSEGRGSMWTCYQKYN